MFDPSKIQYVYIACGYTGLRRGIEGLMNIVRNGFQMDPIANAMFLFCGRRADLEISNNRAERSIKPVVMGWKNFLLANVPKGAEGSAIIYSLIGTAKENQLDPCRYLAWLMREEPSWI